jgi:hypothetical protein
MTELRVCDECVRAAALLDWSAIARHPEAGTDCVLCNRGRGVHEASDFVLEVLERRPGAIGFAMAIAEWRAGEDDR